MSFQSNRPFRPLSATTASLAVTTATGSVALLGQAMQYRVFNAGASTIFVELGNSAVTAVLATAMPIPAGAVEYLSAPVAVAAPYLAAITASGTATVYTTGGEGN